VKCGAYFTGAKPVSTGTGESRNYLNRLDISLFLPERVKKQNPDNPVNPVIYIINFYARRYALCAMRSVSNLISMSYEL
jgi:hypothetical protein